MTLFNSNPGAIAVAGLFATAIAAFGVWRMTRKRPTAEELERARRQFLTQSGRLVDGMLLDLHEVQLPVKGGERPTRTMLLFEYVIGGVDYECSQDITDLLEAVVDTTQMRVGFPCTVRYQPGNPQNSIVVAESWTGIRDSLPVLPVYDSPDHFRRGVWRPGRG
jgi:hypothetical protein